MKKSPVVALACCAFALALVLAGCGGSGSASSTAPSSAANASASAAASASASSVSPEDAATSEGKMTLNEGIDYWFGINGKAFDMAKARDAFKRAAEFGSAEAYYWLGDVRRSREGARDLPERPRRGRSQRGDVHVRACAHERQRNWTG